MKKIDIKKASLWMHRNAREIDLARWKYHFENGDKKEVIDALMLYQNPDGGFGNAIDPDNWNTNSLPYATLYAIDILGEIDFYDFKHPIYKGILKYIDKESNFPTGWVFTVESNQYYPHANFYNYNEEYNKTESIGIVLGLSSFIIEHYKESIIYNDVVNLIEKYITMMNKDNLGDMGPSGYIMLVKAMKNANIKGYDYDKLEMRLKELVNKSIQRNPEEWPFYGYRPSNYIKSKNSIFYLENRDIVDMELDFLVDTLPENDVWPISWSWFDNEELYPKESKISEVWCKANKAIQHSIFLRNFGRVE
ncbi:MAG: hypothetical protein GX275_07875 [Clostridiales bacterium]|nr:hypothetical protein [Clostridiales bacterium]